MAVKRLLEISFIITKKKLGPSTNINEQKFQNTPIYKFVKNLVNKRKNRDM